MEYRLLGSTGIKVSLIGFGSNTMTKRENENEYFAILKKCYDSGINFYDTAEVYGNTVAEEILGNLIKRLGVPREELVISTKLFRTKFVNKDPNATGLSRKHIIEGVKNSLKRLQLDYVDILFCHRFDHETPLEETIRAMNWVIEKGWALHWGTSEWSASQIKEAYGICDKLRLVRPAVEQPQYNLLTRQRFEVEYADLFDNYKIGSTIWSPLCGGHLTGKYLENIEKDSRLSDPKMKIYYWDPYMGANGEKKDEVNQKIKNLKAIAEEMGITLPILALGWTLANKDVSTCMIGATKISQLEENLKAVEIYKKITPEIEEKIEKALGNRPETSMNWKSWSPFPKRR